MPLDVKPRRMDYSLPYHWGLRVRHRIALLRLFPAREEEWSSFPQEDGWVRHQLLICFFTSLLSDRGWRVRIDVLDESLRKYLQI